MAQQAVPMIQMNNGVQIPQIGLGVFRIPDANQAKQTVLAAIDAGYRHIDTASFYENEAAVGDAIRDSDVPRSDLFITSKLWNNVRGYDHVIEHVHATLAKMHLDYLDLFLIHWPAPGYEEVWRALEDLYQAGLLKSIGVSNFTPAQLTQLMVTAKTKPMINQIETHPYFQQDESHAFLMENDILHESWSPLGGGQTNALSEPVITKIAAQHHKSAAQIILRWHVQRGEVVIPKSIQPKRMAENLALFDFQLSEPEMEAIRALDRNQRVGSDPDDAAWLKQSMTYTSLTDRLNQEKQS